MLSSSLAILAVASLLAGWPAAAAALCPGGAALPDKADKRIVVADDVLFFRTDVIKLDLDGSPAAYGVNDQGTEDVCNGLAALTPPQCKGVAKGCTPECRAAFRAWHASGAHVERLRDFMCSVGLGGGGCSEPEVRLQAAPRADWFISESAAKLAPPPGTALAQWLPTQDAQLDATAIPYFVIPSGLRKLPWDATPGDLGVVVPRDGGPAVGFVVGDTGGNLDEGSARLLARLRGLEKLPTSPKTNALGQSVQRLVGEKSGDFRVAIFRHSGVLMPGSSSTKIIDKKASELSSWIASETAARLAAIGGADRVVACTTP